MKKHGFFIWFAAALVGAALIFGGCEQESDDDEEVLVDVDGLYPLLSASDSIDTAGKPGNLEITSAKKSSRDGTVYIVLESTADLEAITDFTNNQLWGKAGEDKPGDGYFADFALDLTPIFASRTDKVFSIKNTNHGLRYYQGGISDDAENGTLADAAPTAPNDNRGLATYIPETGWPVRWYMYGKIAAEDSGKFPFGLLLWSEAPQKTITVEFYDHGEDANEPTTGTLVAKIVIDYSEVTITPAGQ
ncbi:MAG: hypothetical protein LBO04_00835 [Spirochaetaceae bacterium]|jgi:hypothetical protein|nr:hypothetical protein [Spirochaetaceae bacterium]